MDTLIHLDPLPSVESSFAIDEHLSEQAGTRLARLWCHRPSLVLGLRDARLPHADEAISHFRSLGFEVHVRTSGGRLVVLDEGVLNVAIAFSGEHLPSVDEGFRLITATFRESIHGLGLDCEVGEIPGSVCAGKYDISIEGRKIAGVSQRRRRAFALLHGFLLVEGTGRQRAQDAITFYDLAGAPPKDAVQPGTMAALSEFQGSCTIQTAARAVEDVLRAIPDPVPSGDGTGWTG